MCIFQYKLTFAMSNWQFYRMVDTPGKNTRAWCYGQRDPATLKAGRGIVGQRRGEGAGQQTGAHQCLEAIADTQNQSTFCDKLFQLLCQMDLQVFAQQGTRSQVISIRETTR